MFKHLGLAALSASAVAMAFIACGGDGTGTDISCVTDADCTEANTICHPGALVCVQTCTSGADCPDSAKTCGAVSSTDDRQICQCATDTLCAQGDLGTGAVCQEAWSVCTNACTGDTDCPTGFECDTATGQCTSGTASCQNNSECGAGKICDTQSNTCVDAPACAWDACSTETWTSAGQTCGSSGCGAGPTCSGTGLSSCGTNEICSSGTCGLPPRPKPGNTGSQVNCQNFFTGDYANGPVWNPSSDNGPVIYEVSLINKGTGTAPMEGQVGPGDFGLCLTNTTQFNVRVRAYRTDADWPATRTAWASSGPALFYVDTAGTRRDVQASPSSLLRPNVGYNPSGRTVDIQLYFCGSGTSFQPGFAFGSPTGMVRGNEACRQL